MNFQDRFAELWTDYLEGELDESGLAELQALLAADEKLLQQATDLYQTHRLLGVLGSATLTQQEFVSETMSRLPVGEDQFVSGVMSQLGQPVPPEQAQAQEAQSESPAARLLNFRMNIWSGVAVAIALAVVAVVGISFWRDFDRNPQQLPAEVRLASQAHARFFGELAPPVGATIPERREYVLMSGLVELSFPAGASAIIEGPAVFQVLSPESLALNVGRCSVHAPEGAEGFHVETPVTRVVDRGTRFAVNVSETSETEVQIIEGAADVYRRQVAEPNNTASAEPDERLVQGEAQKFADVGTFSADKIPFNPQAYRQQLPDRVISYKVTTEELTGDRHTPGSKTFQGAQDLVSITMQRGGKVAEIPVEQIIPAEVVYFKGSGGGGYVAGNVPLPELRRSTSSDHGLTTGIINPGGSRTPLTRDPVLEDSEHGTPGMAIKFAQPVQNGPGADVVLFDLQSLANPLDGDPFHVSPLEFRPGLKSHTVWVYDLTVESPAALDLTDFHVYIFEKPVTSLAALESLECKPRLQAVRYRAIAVGIDLSDLGYGEHETAEGLFLQDALDDKHFVDPVFIGGLPMPEGSNE